MSFLAPMWIPLVAAGVAIPSLLAFYFLKLRRREVAVSSTLLWKQAVQDLQVNAPFQRLRNNLLLWLQLAALAVAAFCLWQPVLRKTQTDEKTVIMLIDQSASMGTVEADGRTRLELAKEAATTYVDNLDARSKAMIICFNEQARVAESFTTDKHVLRDRIEAIEQTDCASRLTEAVALAEAYSTRQIISSGGADLTPESPTEAAELLLFSDGRIEDAAELVLRRGGMQIAHIGATADNVGIVGLRAKRNYERPEELNVFVTVGNFGTESVKSDVTLEVEGGLPAVGDVSLGPARVASTQPAFPTSQDDASGSANNVGAVSFKQTYDRGGILRVTLNRPDALAADNEAWLVVPPPRSLRVLLVSSGNYFLSRVLSCLPLRQVKRIDPEVFEANRDEFAPGGRLDWDVAIMDRCSPEDLPVGNYLFFGAIPKIEEVKDLGETPGEFVYDWDEQHPVLRHVVLNYLRVGQCRRMELPKRADVLVEGETTPIVAAVSEGPSRFVIVAFHVYESNWPLRVSFPVFVYNAVRYLSDSIAVAPSQSVRPGTAASIPVLAGAERITVKRPDGRSDALDVGERQGVYYSDTKRLGVYRVEPAVGGYEAFAVNLLNPTESNIRPKTDFAIGSEQVSSSETIRRKNQPLWPWLMLGVLAVLLLEWFIYNRRMHV